MKKSVNTSTELNPFLKTSSESDHLTLHHFNPNLRNWIGYYFISGGEETVKGTVLLIQIISMLFYNSHGIPGEISSFRNAN